MRARITTQTRTVIVMFRGELPRVERKEVGEEEAGAAEFVVEEDVDDEEEGMEEDWLVAETRVVVRTRELAVAVLARVSTTVLGAAGEDRGRVVCVIGRGEGERTDARAADR